MIHIGNIVGFSKSGQYGILTEAGRRAHYFSVDARSKLKKHQFVVFFDETSFIGNVIPLEDCVLGFDDVNKTETYVRLGNGEKFFFSCEADHFIVGRFLEGLPLLPSEPKSASENDYLEYIKCCFKQVYETFSHIGAAYGLKLTCWYVDCEGDGGTGYDVIIRLHIGSRDPYIKALQRDQFVKMCNLVEGCSIMKDKAQAVFHVMEEKEAQEIVERCKEYSYEISTMIYDNYDKDAHLAVLLYSGIKKMQREYYSQYEANHDFMLYWYLDYKNDNLNDCGFDGIEDAILDSKVSAHNNENAKYWNNILMGDLVTSPLRKSSVINPDDELPF